MVSDNEKILFDDGAYYIEHSARYRFSAAMVSGIAAGGIFKQMANFPILWEIYAVCLKLSVIQEMLKWPR
jgi:hypothetical protein